MRVRFECVPCGAVNVLSVLDVVPIPDGSVRVVCPECSVPLCTWPAASLWWWLVCARASVRDDLETFAEELGRVRTPADLVGGL